MAPFGQAPALPANSRLGLRSHTQTHTHTYIYKHIPLSYKSDIRLVLYFYFPRAGLKLGTFTSLANCAPITTSKFSHFQWGSVNHQMAVPVPSISCCVFNNNDFCCQELNELAFNWDTCCHLVICLQLIASNCTNIILATGKMRKM